MLEDLKSALRGLLRGTRFSQTKNNGPLFHRVTEDGTDESEGRLILAPVCWLMQKKAPTPRSTWRIPLWWLKTLVVGQFKDARVLLYLGRKCCSIWCSLLMVAPNAAKMIPAIVRPAPMLASLSMWSATPPMKANSPKKIVIQARIQSATANPEPDAELRCCQLSVTLIL